MFMPEPDRFVWLLLDARGVGGIETHVAALCAALRRRATDARVVLLTDHGDTPALNLFRAHGLPVQILQGGFLALYRAVRAQRPSLVHTHGYKAGVLGRIVTALTGTPCVSTHHAGERGAFPVNVYQRIDEALSRWSKNIAVNGQIASRLRDAVVIPNFVPKPKYAPLGDLPLGHLPRVVAVVGRLSIEKGPDLFCEIARKCPGLATFRIYGDGPMAGRLREIYAHCVDFRGHVENMEPVWSEVGLLLMPSRAEGLPMACLEAMAHGVPVLAARVGALPEVIQDGHSGWLFEPCVIDDACFLIFEWSRLDRAAQRAMREACVARVASSYSEDTALEAVMQVYTAARGLPSSRITVQSSAG